MATERNPQSVTIYIHLEPRQIKRLPDHPEDYWAEPKLDGMRAFVTIVPQESTVTITANSKDRKNNQGLDITKKFPEIEAGARQLSHSVVFDGEIINGTGKTVTERNIVLERHSTSDYNNLWAWQDKPCKFAAFDILYLEGEDLSQLPYEERKRRLFELLDEETQQKTGIVPVPANDDAKIYTDVLKDQEFEGVVYKKIGSPYPSRRLTSSKRPWAKLRFRP